MVTRKQQMKVPEVVVAQVDEARRRLQKFEREVVARGRQQQRELEALVGRVRSGKDLKQLEKRASALGGDVRKRFDKVMKGFAGSLGLASRAEIREVNKELGKLSKKVDALARRLTAEHHEGARAVN
jgi:uncharacterized protein YukE